MGLYELRSECIVDEKRVVWFKRDVCSVFLLCVFSGVILQYASFELCNSYDAVSVASHFEMSAERVYCLCTHTVKTHTLLECL